MIPNDETLELPDCDTTPELKQLEKIIAHLKDAMIVMSDQINGLVAIHNPPAGVDMSNILLPSLEIQAQLKNEISMYLDTALVLTESTALVQPFGPGVVTQVKLKPSKRARLLLRGWKIGRG